MNEPGNDVAAIELMALEHILLVADFTEGLRRSWLYPEEREEWPELPEPRGVLPGACLARLVR